MTVDIRFRRATLDDLPAMVAMLADDMLGATREKPGLPLDPGYLEAFAELDANPHELLVVAERDGAVVGSMQISFLRGIGRRGATRGQIEAVRVDSALRGQGLGAAMIQWAVDECRRRGCFLVQLTSDKARVDAHRFYDRLGFTASHVGYKLNL